MTTATTWLPTVRPFTPEECAILASAGIITEDEQAAVLAGKRRFTVDECMEMLEAGVLHEDDRIELIDGELLIMAPIGDNHEETTDWLTELCVLAFAGRAIVRVQGSIRLNNMSAYTNVRTYLPGESVSPRAFPDVSLAVADFVAPPGGSFDETD
jgi:hypothetical protein